MLMFTLAILLFDHFQFILICGPNIPGSYAILFLQHQILLPSPVTSSTGHGFRFGFPFLHSFWNIFFPSCLVAYWAPTHLGSLSFNFIYFCLFILFMGFSRQEYWSGLPIPSPMDHNLSEPSTMTHPSWLALHSIAHSFTELEKAVIPVVRLISFQWLWFSFCLPSDR